MGTQPLPNGDQRAALVTTAKWVGAGQGWTLWKLQSLCPVRVMGGDALGSRDKDQGDQGRRGRGEGEERAWICLWLWAEVSVLSGLVNLVTGRYSLLNIIFYF